MTSRRNPNCLLAIFLSIASMGLGNLFVHQASAQRPGGQQPTEAMMAKAAAAAKAMNVPKDPAAVIAVVGTSQILFGDVKNKVDLRVKQIAAKASEEIPEDLLEIARVNFTRQLLAQAIQSKQMRESFLLDQVGTADAAKRREASEMMTSRARQMFFETEVEQLKKKHGVTSLVELDDTLRAEGSSLKSRELEFMDAMLGHMFMTSSVEKDPNVTLSEINSYYASHKEEFQRQSRATWEQFTVLFSNHPTREAAQAKIWEMGREAFFGGNLQAVARAKSEEPFASDGGLHDWTNQGSLASKELDIQIFSLPLNKMSEIIEDESGFHIIRVLNREDAGLKSLGLVQEEIREQLKKKKIRKAQVAMIAKMQDKVPVWSIFPQDIPGAVQLNTPRVATQPSAQPGTQKY